MWEFEKIGEGFVSVSIQVNELEARGFGFLAVDRVPYSSSDSDLVGRPSHALLLLVVSLCSSNFFWFLVSFLAFVAFFFGFLN